jgi:hypothetical protein
VTERPAGLDDVEDDWDHLVALVAYSSEAQACIAFGAERWAEHCAGHRPDWVWIEDELDNEIFGPGYRWVDLRDGSLVGILEPGGEAWADIPLVLPEGFEPTGGRWMTRRSDGTVAYYDEWLAEHPEGH